MNNSDAKIRIKYENCNTLWELFAIIGVFFVPLQTNYKLKDVNDES